MCGIHNGPINFQNHLSDFKIGGKRAISSFLAPKIRIEIVEESSSLKSQIYFELMNLKQASNFSAL